MAQRLTRLIFFIPLLLFMGNGALAQEKEPIYNLKNPRNAISRHLYYLRNENDQYDPAISASALSPNGLDQAKREELALKLKQLFDTKGAYINPDDLPDDPLYADERNRNRFKILPELYPEIYLERTANGDWLYSPSSVRQIDVLYQRVVPALTRGALAVMPSFLKSKFLGLQLWKYLGLLIIAAAAFLLFFIFRWVFSLIIKRMVIPLLSRTDTVDVNLIPPVTRPLGFLAVAWVMKEQLVPGLLLPIQVSKPIVTILQVLIPFFGVMVLIRFVDVLADLARKIASKTATNFDNQAIPIIVKGAKLVVGVLGSILILSALGVNVTALLAGVSIGGLALALAAQETVKNFIGSMAIFFDRPFIVGDFIATADLSGVVVEVGLRSSRIRALDGAQISIPNGKLVDMVITNHGVRNYRRYATTLGLTYDTPPAKVERFVEGVREIAMNHPKSREDSVTVQFHEMADSSLNVFFAVIYDTVDYGEWLKARQEVFVEIMKMAKELEVSFAFPSTSVYVEAMPVS